MKKILAFVILAVSLLLSACGTASMTQPTASAFPTGTFVDAQDKLRGYVFNEDMTWKYFTLGTGSTAASGTYGVRGNRWVDAGGVGDYCQPGTYEWSFDGTNLAFKVVGEDACSARKASLDGHTFVLTP